MRWRGRRQSKNIEDQRGSSSRGGFSFPRRGGGFRFPRGRGLRVGGKRGGLGGVGLIAVVVIMWFLGVDPAVILQSLTGNGGGQFTSPQTNRQPAKLGDDPGKFVAVVLADTEDAWRLQFKQLSKTYKEPKLVLFSNVVRSACGTAQSATGPFYCPGDQKIYIDLSFFQEMKSKLGAPGDFAQAYVVAHEVGHHVQTLLGISNQVRRAKSNASRVQANAIQVRMELQADCMAGIWANNTERAKQILEAGDIDEALNAASAIGDDRLQQRSGGRVTPDSFTHGTSAQRSGWFKRGFKSGQLNSCDTFKAAKL